MIKLTKTITIIGGGLSGLVACREAAQAVADAILLEASLRTGGMIETVYDSSRGLYERGAQFINGDHHEVLDLISELGIQPIDFKDKEREPMLFECNGEAYDEKLFFTELKPLIDKISSDRMKLGDEPLPLNDLFITLDNQSVEEYISTLSLSPIARSLFEAQFTSEWGAELKNQSALNLVFSGMEKMSLKGRSLFGEFYQRFQLAEGTSEIITRLEDDLEEQIFRGMTVTKIEKSGHSLTVFGVSSSGEDFQIETSHAILAVNAGALPNIKGLENICDASSLRKLLEFRNTYMTKTVMGFKCGEKGELPIPPHYSATLCGEVWQNGRGAEGEGTITVFRGGDAAKHFADLKQEDEIQVILSTFEKVAPESREAFTGFVDRVDWSKRGGGYVAYPPGGHQLIRSWKNPSQLSIIGEYMDVPNNAYMEGAVRSAKRAVISALSH